MSAATALALGALGTVLVGTAAAANPTCGQTITASVTLTADVGPCNNGDGLVVEGASNIVINLNGHRVFANAPLPRNLGCVQSPSPNAAVPVPVPCTPALPGAQPVVFAPADFVGIHILDSTGVVVRSGTVEGFSAGIAIEGGGGNTVRNILAQNNQGPCVGEDFTTQAVGTYGDGIVILSSTNNKIQSNVTQNNGPFDGIGVVANTFLAVQPVPDQPLPTGNQITNNVSQKNNTCFADIGIKIEGPGASNNTVSGNQVTANFNEGIFLAAVNTIDFSGAFPPPGQSPTCSNFGIPTTQTVSSTSGSAVVTATQGTFSQADVGKTLAFPGNKPFPGTVSIVSVQSPTQATFNVAATATLTGIGISTLPQCPVLNPLNPNNNNNRVINNQVSNNGFGGVEQFAGPVAPNTPPRVSNQAAGGLVLRSFCGFGVENGMNTLVQGNYSIQNAGNGINVGGCAPNPATGQFDPGRFPGWTNNQILNNVAVDNARNSANARDLVDGNIVPVPCDNNRWFGNRYRTFNQPCVTAGGTPVAAAARTAAQPRMTVVSTSADKPYPLRTSSKRK
ncbi:MAG: right-handed parallel beta-helix repeat-containing protein [Actinobacteria bacterium]|nr:right-handed parallel beta-helix repeat-containing protein [Actinomycetota bacterium]